MLITEDPSDRHDQISTAFTGITEASQTTPAQQYDDPLADVFGSDTDSIAAGDTNTSIEAENHARTAQEGPSDITRLRSTHVTNGYRDGIGAGKEETIQAGFDEGYALGAEFGIVIGRIIGVLEALLDVVPELSGASDAASPEDVEQLLLRAREELAIEKLFGSTFFDESGLWTYQVVSENGTELSESEITFRRVAASHPTVTEMSRLADVTAKRCGLELSNPLTRSETHEEMT